MSKEALAIAGLGLTLMAAIFGFGVRIGTLTERVETQTKQIDRLTTEVQAVNAGIVQWTINHRDDTR